MSENNDGLGRNFKILSFCKKNKGVITLGVAILFLVFYSLPNLTTKPRLSYDEGFFIEEAHNFEQFGVLDIITAPNTFSGLPHIASSSGFPGTLPLAIFFGLVGFGIEQARAYALLWMMLCLIAVYFLARREFGITSAIGTTLLIVTFPPFHNSGRMAMGDIPGFTYLLISLLLLARHSFSGGFFLGLAVISRPSVYAGAFVAKILQFLYSKGRRAIQPVFFVTLSVLISIFISLALYLPGSVTKEWWIKTFLFLRAPTFGLGNTPGHNFIQNVFGFFTEQTLIYFSLLFILIVIAYFFGGKRLWSKDFVVFTSIYGLFVLAYFMKSPGWLKYLLPVQLIIFFYLPSALLILAERFLVYTRRFYFANFFSRVNAKRLASFAVGICVCLHLVQLFFFADIFKSSETQQTYSFLVSRESTSTVAFIHTSAVAALFPSERKYSFNVVNETLFVGENPLGFSKDHLSTYIVMPDEISSFSRQFQGAYQETLNVYYSMVFHTGQLVVYRLK